MVFLVPYLLAFSFALFTATATLSTFCDIRMPPQSCAHDWRYLGHFSDASQRAKVQSSSAHYTAATLNIESMGQ